jgi:8-hydroxy-5-deazaflavin:NADPH oxidoreductase
LKIGIIGSGNIGSTVASLFAKTEHNEIAISNSRGPNTIVELTKSLGPNVSAKSPEDTVKFGEVILLAIPWRKKHELPDAKLFENKIVVDAMNPYSENYEIIDLGESTSSEEVAKQIPGCKLVKAFNTIYYKDLASKGRPDISKENRSVIFVAGDDLEAKKAVSGLIEEIGFMSVDTGSLKEGGKKQQPGSPIYNNPINVEQANKLLLK